MALRGVWQLRELAIRYSLGGGSSRGVRDFVENGLVDFARTNPHIKITTHLEPGHPNVHGKYLTGYEKNLSLMNMDSEQVRDRIQLLRDTLGKKTPKHNEMSFVERDFVSVQGFWRNTAEMRMPALPADVAVREQRRRDHGLQKTIDEIGVAGVARVVTKLQERQRAAMEAALAKLPRKERVLPTE